MNVCLYCQRTFSNKGGLGSHQPFCKANPDRVQRNKSPNAHRRKGSEPWNKGVVGAQVAWNKGLTGLKGTPHTEKTKQRLSEVAKERKLGGYVQGSGRGKKGWYKGFFCDSSWELAYVIYCLEHNIKIVRNTEKRQYTWKNRVKNYIPDFIVEGSLVEVKGYKTEQWLAKIKANPDVKVLYEQELKPVLDYVKNKYGKNFIDLYEHRAVNPTGDGIGLENRRGLIIPLEFDSLTARHLTASANK